MDKYARFRYQPCLPLGKDGKRVTASKKHINISRKAACEGMVLLKNINNALPLNTGEKTALFGKATIEYIKGGGGSGDVNSPYIHNIYDGFSEKEKENKITVYKPLIKYYTDYVEMAEKSIPTNDDINKIWDIVNNMEFCQKRDDITYDTFDSMHVKEPDVPDELIVESSKECNTAIITISRFSAEGVDRRPQPGDYYLSQTEIRLIDKVTSLFNKVIIVINSGGLIDCEYFADNDKIQAILMSWQGGMEGGMAIADIITGDITPSGKMPDTLPKSYDFCPDKDDFNESFDYVNYHNDIYVGYRYYFTIPKKDTIRYPFGYGLSYTKFKIDVISCKESKGKVRIVFNVKNIGDYSGKEVVQIYYSAPQGKLGKPAIELIAFKKTKTLLPDESQKCIIVFDIDSMASFDDLGAISKSAYILEKGPYTLYIGNSSDNLTELDYNFIAEKDIITEQLTQLCKPFKLDKRLLSDGSYQTLQTCKSDYKYVNTTEKYIQSNTTISFDKVNEEISMSDFVNQFTPDEMMEFVGGQKPTGVANTGCFGGLERLKVPAIPTADGPAGLRLNTETGITTTAIPCATLLAATFNESICYEVGKAVASEIRENNIGIWLAPALNIHKNPLCGRNFEYFSEDPILAGKCAAAEFRGIQSEKVAVSMKHFACNNKEANRFASDSRLSERALREIYLKCFEIAVKEGKPWTVMSSYNLINGQHTSESWELLTGILRNEWGFDGMVVTDWGVKNNPVLEIKAGNDMKMHVGYPDDLKAGIDNEIISLNNLKESVMRILNTFIKLAE